MFFFLGYLGCRSVYTPYEQCKEVQMASNVTHFVPGRAQVAARLDRNRQVVYLTGTADALKAPGMTSLLCKNVLV